jgi:zinc protease
MTNRFWMLRRFLAMGCAALMFAGFLQPAQAFDIKFDEFTLSNGMTVIVIPDRRAPVVTNSVWYRVGAADEITGKSGLAHFLEHLMFKGTKRFPYGEFDRLLKINGAEGNAFTTHDYTGYYQRAAKDRLPLLMELEADRMQNLVLSEENVRPELQVVVEERNQRIENSPSALLGEQISAAQFTAHPYGKPVIGWMSDVTKLTMDDALAFYRQYYKPANAVVIIAGDVETSEVKALAEKFYGTLVNPDPPKARARTPEPASIVSKRVSMMDERAETPYLSRSYVVPSLATSREEAVALDFLASAIGEGSRSRLYKALVLEQKLATEAGAWYNGNQLDSGTFTVYAVPNPGVGFERIEAAIDRVLVETLEKGVTQEELDRIRRRAETQRIFAVDNQMNLIQAAGTAVMTGQTAADAFSTDYWKSVNAGAVQVAARKFLTPANSVTATLSRGEGK